MRCECSAVPVRQYYEIRRAKTMVEICGARHGDAAVQKELPAVSRRSLNNDAPQIKASSISTADANATGSDRSKVHPADKYIEEGLAASALDVSRAPSVMDPEVSDVAAEEC